MQVHNTDISKHVILESDVSRDMEKTLPLETQVTLFQEKTEIQEKLIAEQASQINSLIRELNKFV